MPLTEGSFDAVALFFNLRCEDAAKFRPGEKHTLEMVLEDTIRRINYRLAGREVRNIKGVGKFLIKLGGLPGIPVNVQMCDIERSGFNDTNAKWSR